MYSTHQQAVMSAPTQSRSVAAETFLLDQDAQQSLPQDSVLALQQVDNRGYIFANQKTPNTDNPIVKYFLISAPVEWQPDQYIRRFLLPTGEYVSCVLWCVLGLAHCLLLSMTRKGQVLTLMTGTTSFTCRARTLCDALRSASRLSDGQSRTRRSSRRASSRICETSSLGPTHLWRSPRARSWTFCTRTIVSARKRSKRSSTGTACRTIGSSWTRWNAT